MDRQNTFSIRQSFADSLTRLAGENHKIFVVDADLKSSIFLDNFAKKFPDRFIECGVAESNAAGIAAGLAKTGKTVFLTSFACFSPAINWNTIKQSICYNNANVKIIGSHAGLMSTDLGATHQMLEDIAITRILPNLDVFAPMDSLEMEKMLPVVAYSPKPAYIRLVRASTPVFSSPKNGFTIGQSHILKPGKDITILGYGPILSQALEAQAKLLMESSKISLEIINCSSINPLDEKTIIKSVKKTGRLIVIEDHQKHGGLGEMVSARLLESGIYPKFISLAVKGSFGQSAKTYAELYEHYGIGTKQLLDSIKKIL